MSLSEALMPVKEPKTKEEAKALLELILWVSDKLNIGERDVEDAIDRALEGDWSLALDILSTYYVMKGIQAPKRKFQ